MFPLLLFSVNDPSKNSRQPRQAEPLAARTEKGSLQRGVQAQIEEPLTVKGSTRRKRSDQGDQDKSARKKSTGLGSRETASQVFVFSGFGARVAKALY